MKTKPASVVKPNHGKLEWSVVEESWICSLCQKKFRSKQACNKHNSKECQNTQPQNPSWQLGWDRKTMSCRYCGQTGFKRRRNIRKHIQNRNCSKLPNWSQVFGRDLTLWQKEPGSSGKIRKDLYQQLRKSLKAKSLKAASGVAPGRPGTSAPVPEDDESGDDSGSSEENDEETLGGPPGNIRSVKKPWTQPQHTVGNSGEGWPTSTSFGNRPPAFNPPTFPPSQPGPPAYTSQRYPPSHPGQGQAAWTNTNPGQARGPRPGNQFASQRGAHMSQPLPANQRKKGPTRMHAMVRDADPPAAEHSQVWPPDDGNPREAAGQTWPRQASLPRPVEPPQHQHGQYPDPREGARHNSSSRQWTGHQQKSAWMNSNSRERQVRSVEEEDYRGTSHDERYDSLIKLAHGALRDQENMIHHSRYSSYQETASRDQDGQQRFLHDAHPSHDRRGGPGRDKSSERRASSDQPGNQGSSHYRSYEERGHRDQDIQERYPNDDLNPDRRGHFSRDGNRGRNYFVGSDRHEGQSLSGHGRYSPAGEKGHGDQVSRRRSRSPVGRRETGGRPEGGVRYAERESWDSYRGTYTSHERDPAPEQFRRREYNEDNYQVPREYSGSRDAGYRGYQTDRGKGRYPRHY